MGCCESTPDAPEIIIPDPGDTECCTFSVESAGMMSNDSIIYRGQDVDDKEQRWFFMNKTGSIFSGSAVIELENFLRGGNPDKPNQGEVMWTANFDSSPQFAKHFKSPSTAFSRFFSGFMNNEHDGDDYPDDYYFDRAGHQFRDGGYRRVMKWSLNTSATISPGKRGQAFSPGFELKVFASGTSIADYDESRDPESGQTEWKHQEKEFVDRLVFQVVLP